MKRGSGIAKIAYRNLGGDIMQSFLIFFLLFVVSFTLFVNGVLSASLRKGIRISEERLGADLIVVPSAFVSDVNDALFKGKACTIYFPAEWEERIKGFEGVEKTSTQLYVASLGASDCCDGDVQLVAIDPDSDFSVGPWIDEKGLGGLEKNEAIAGKGLGLKVGDQVKYYGRDYVIKAVLDETGMGYDSNVFISREAAQENKENKLYASKFSFSNATDFVSMVQVKTANGADANEIKKAIEKEYGKEEISVYTISSLIGSYAQRVASFSVFGIISEIFIVLAAAAACFGIFSMRTLLRKNEIGSMLSLGWGMKRVRKIYAIEYITLALAGSICGILFGALIVLPFKNLIKSGLGLPYCGISFSEFLLIGGIGIVVSLLLSIFALIYSLRRVRHKSPAELVNENN